MLFNKAELSLIKNTFANNDELLYAVRNVLLQFPLTDAQKQLIRAQVTPEVIRVLKKRIFPEIGPEFPLGQLPSLLTTLTNDLKVKDPEEMGPLFSSKVTQIAYLEQQFNVLKDLDAPQPLKLDAMANLVGQKAEDAFIAINAYLFLLGYIDPMLLFIKSIAGEKHETPLEQEKRLKRDSNQ